MLKKLKQVSRDLISYVSPSLWLKLAFKDYEGAGWGNIESRKLKAEPFLLKYLVTPDQKLFDVGAHIGEYIFMGRDILPEAHVFAFEPNPGSCKLLKRVYKNARIYNIALSNRSGTDKFKIPVVNGDVMPTRGSLNVDYQEQGESDQYIITVKTQTIDSFVAENRVADIGLIKIDVEGYEYSVVEGALNTIRTQKPILIAELEQRHMDEPLDNIIDRIKALGYRCFYFNEDSKGVLELRDSVNNVQFEKYFKVNPVRYVNNFIFIGHESPVISRLDAINEQIREESKK